jgi:hypothetical protein
MSVLLPGDLVNIVTGENDKAQAGASLPIAPMGDKPPAGRAADRSETTGRAVADKRTGSK